MTLQQIHYIIVIAETGSMNKAAEQLYIAQPSLTSAVKELEKEMIKKYGYKAEYYAHVGAAVSANAGPDLVGLACRRNMSK